jgi:mono/diheme cytochrome c family protein
MTGTLMKKIGWKLGLGGLLAVLLMATGTYVLGSRSQSMPDQLRANDLQVVNAGARLYTQHCAACHGTRGQGQPDWRERGHTWHHPDAQLFAITKYGLA